MNLLNLVIAVVAAVVASTTSGLTLNLSHDYGEIVDRGEVRAWVSYDLPYPTVAYLCPNLKSIVRKDNKIELTIPKADDGQYYAADGSLCYPDSGFFSIGALPAGAYEVTARVLSQGGATISAVTQPMTVLPVAGRCNADPSPEGSTIAGFPRNESVADLVTRVKADPSFAASLGNPIAVSEGYDEFADRPHVNFEFPPLFDVSATIDQMSRAYPWYFVPRKMANSCNDWFYSNQSAQFIEYFHSGLGNYFYTSNASEIAALDSGAPKGWVRTSKSFKAETTARCESGEPTAVYRFYGIPPIGPDTHFFTHDRAECSVVNKSAKWTFEGVAFFATAPRKDGACEPLTYYVDYEGTVTESVPRVPLYRAWRSKGVTNHRFSTDRAVIDEMVGKGWVDEGAVMCLLAPS